MQLDETFLAWHCMAYQAIKENVNSYDDCRSFQMLLGTWPVIGVSAPGNYQHASRPTLNHPCNNTDPPKHIMTSQYLQWSTRSCFLAHPTSRTSFVVALQLVHQFHLQPILHRARRTSPTLMYSNPQAFFECRSNLQGTRHYKHQKFHNRFSSDRYM